MTGLVGIEPVAVSVDGGVWESGATVTSVYRAIRNIVNTDGVRLISKARGRGGPKGTLVHRVLRSPVESGQIWVFALGPLRPLGLFRLALFAPRFLLALLHLLRFFTVALGERRFGWSSDDILLVGVRSPAVYLKTGPPLKKKMTNGVPDRSRSLSGWAGKYKLA